VSAIVDQAGPSPPGSSTPDLSAGWARDIVLVTVIAALSVTAAQAARPMVTYRAIELGASLFEIGLVQSIYSLLPMLTAIALGRWNDQFGEPIITALGCVALTIGAVILALASSLEALAVGQVLMGFGVIATAIATQSFVANRGPQNEQVLRFSWFSVAISVGQIAGPAGAALLVPNQPAVSSASTSGSTAEAMVFAAAAVLSLVALALVRSLPRPPRVTTSSAPLVEASLGGAAIQVLRTPGVASAIFVSLTVASSLDVLIVYLPAYGEVVGLSVATVGALLAARAAATLIARAFMSQLTSRFGPGTTLLATTALAGLSVFVLALEPQLWVLVILMVGIGLGLGIGQPLTVAWIGTQTPPSQRGLAFGVRHTGNLAALIAVPAVMGLIAGTSGIDAIWVAAAIVLAVAAVVAAKTTFAA
jgi:MFS family permease